MRCFLMKEDYRYCWGDHHQNLPNTAPELRDIQLCSAANSFVAFQIVVAPDTPIMVTVGNRACFTPHGQVDTVRVEVEGDAFVLDHTRLNLIGLVDDDDGTYQSDILLEQETIFCDKKRQQVWVEADVPADTPAGCHTGCIKLFISRMFESERLLDTLPFTLEVRPVSLPDAGQYSFYLDLWQHTCNIARKADVRYFSDAHFAVLEEYVKALAALGQKAVSVVVSEVPWAGQNCSATENYPSDLFEYSFVSCTKTPEGFVYDYSAMDRYVELCFSYGIMEEIEVFGLTGIWTFQESGFGKPAPDYPEAMRVRYSSEVGSRYMTTAAELEDYVKSLEAHFVEKGWIDRVRVAADEPADVKAYRETLANLKRIAPQFRIKAATNRIEFIEEFAGEVNDFVPVLSDLVQKTEFFKAVRPKVKGRTAYYVCCHPQRPNSLLASPLIECRLIPLLAAWLGLDGFLRWNFTVWPEHPRQKLSYRSGVWRSGDTNFVYPGNNGKPLLSLRYKLLRRGIQDFELLQMAKRCAADGEALQQKFFDQIIKVEKPAAFYRFTSDGQCLDANPAADLYELDAQKYDEAVEMLISAIQGGDFS